MASCCWTGLVCSALLLTGCAAHADLQTYSVVPNFTLTDQTGAKFDSAAALRGQVWIADFIFTNCSGPCPRMSAQMHEVQTALAGSDGVKLVSFTVDPERDTPEVLAGYSNRYQAQPGRWFFLTGSQETLNDLSRKAFMLGDVNGSLEHSTRFVLIDRASRVRGFYLTSDDDAIPRLVSDAKNLLKESL
ncbi:MAG: SCO family protein [Bryobacteraceae bacterium]|jgi:protein SCO1/2